MVAWPEAQLEQAKDGTRSERKETWRRSRQGSSSIVAVVPSMEYVEIFSFSCQHFGWRIFPTPNNSSFAVQSTWYSDRQGRLESSLKFRRVEGRGGALDRNGGVVEVADRWEFNSGESVSPSEDCATRWEEGAN